MKIVFYCLLSFSFLSSCSQQSSKTLFFEKIGWTITVPTDFDFLDSNTIANNAARGSKTIDSMSHIKFDASKVNRLISIKKNNNYLLATINPIDTVNNKGWENQIEEKKNLFYDIMVRKIPTMKFDSSTTLETIDKLVFEKFTITAIKNGNAIVHTIYYSKLYKSYDFEINSIFMDDKIGNQINTILKDSKFTQ